MPSTSPRQTSLSPRLILGFALLPVILFYTLVIKFLVNLPYEDDYDNILRFLNIMHGKAGLAAKVVYVLTDQHNEYKVFFENTIFALQYAVLGHTNLVALCIFGDLSILFLGIVLWKMFLPTLENRFLRLVLFVPVTWLIFQLSYSETVNWAAPAIQNLYIPVFSFATFLFLAKDGRRSFLAALACLVLAIATSGNGFIAAFVGLLMLVRARQFRRVLPWVAVTGGMAALYAYHYNVMSSQSPKQHSVLVTVLHLKLFYVFPFLGSAAASFIPNGHPIKISIAIGMALILFLAVYLFRGGISRHPAVVAAIVFLLLTAIGVAGLRSDFGAAQSMSSRYRIYSSLMLVCVYFVLAEKHLANAKEPLRRNWLYLGALGFSILFCFKMDLDGYRYFRARKAAILKEMAIFEHPKPGTSPGPDELHIMSPTPEWNLGARDTLLESEHLGIYQPPDVPLAAQ